MSKILFLVDLKSLEVFDWFFDGWKKQLKYIQFIPANPDSNKLEDYIKKRKSIEKYFKDFETIVCLGKTARLFNPKFDPHPFSHLKIRIYDLSEEKKSKEFIPTQEYLEIYTFPSIMEIAHIDAPFNFSSLISWLRTIKKLDVSEIIEQSVINEKDIIYYSHHFTDYEVERFLDESADFDKNKILSEIPNRSFVAIDTEFFPVDLSKRIKREILDWYTDNTLVFLTTISYMHNDKIKVLVFFYPIFKEKILDLLKDLILKKEVYFVGSNIAIDFKVLLRDIPEFYNKLANSLDFFKLHLRDLRDYIISIDNSWTKSQSLKILSAFFLFEYPYYLEQDEIFEIGKKSLIENKIENEKFIQYAIKDSVCSLELAHKLDKLLYHKKVLLDHLDNVSRLCFDMSFRGLKVKKDILLEYKEKAKQIILQLEKIFLEKYNISNPKSIKQIQAFISKFEEKELFPRTKKSNQISLKTSYIVEHYFELRDKIKNPELQEFLDIFYKYKLISHYNSTFLEYDKFLDQNNFLHPDFEMHKISSGRIVSVHPCVQQMPDHKTYDKKTRKVIDFLEYREIINLKDTIFEPLNPNHTIIRIDLAQADVRIAQIVSNDKKIKEYFQEGDGYSKLAAHILNANNISFLDRFYLKTTFLGLLYGITLKGVYRTLTTQGTQYDPNKIEVFYEKTKEILQDYQKYLDIIRSKILYQKRIDFFRSRNFNSIIGLNLKKLKKSFWRKEFGNILRSAYNFEIQGLTSDILLLITYRTLKECLEKNIDLRVSNFIYDEVWFEVDKNRINEFIDIFLKNSKLDEKNEFEKYLFYLIKKQINAYKLDLIDLKIETKV